MPSANLIPFTPDLPLVLPTIMGNVDAETLIQQLKDINELLHLSGTEIDFVSACIHNHSISRPAEFSDKPLFESPSQQVHFQQRARTALRASILRSLLGLSCRDLSATLGTNFLYQWFCLIDRMDVIKVPSKSSIDRFSRMVPYEQLDQIISNLINRASHDNTLGLDALLDGSELYIDSTCLKTNIHFPVDWLLFRDAVRSLSQSVSLIRKAGLKHRMDEPETFLSKINQLCIEMTHQKHDDIGRKARKRIVRKMDKLTDIVAKHAKNHRALIDERWTETDYTRGEVDRILRDIDRIFELLPAARRQAIERIVKEKPVSNKEKVLSFYEPDTQVVMRGKAGARVEFGNTVFLAENLQGVIVDWDMYRDKSPGDAQLLFECLTRVWTRLEKKPSVVVTDRGFASQANSEALKHSGTEDGTCPRSPKELMEKLKDPDFVRQQKRRGQTEARVAILKQSFLGEPSRAKGYDNRRLNLSWGVLTHNLWKLAQMRGRRRQAEEQAAQAKAA